MCLNNDGQAQIADGRPLYSWVEIDLCKLRRNILRVRSMLGEKSLLMEVIKSNAYGHGLCQCANCAEPYVDWFAVSTAWEGVRLRQTGCKKPILVLGLLCDSEVEAAAKHHLTVNFCSIEYTGRLNDLLSESRLVLDGHLEIDTGMNRTGLKARHGRLEATVEAAKGIYTYPNLRVTGVYTHFACPDALENENQQFTQTQWELFQEVCNRLTRDGYDLGIRHCLSSTGLIWHPEFKLDMVRSGMLPLGMADTAEHVRTLDLQPVMTWYARVMAVEEVLAGESVSYDRVFTAKRKTRLAVISAGYADGYSRSYTNRMRVLIRGRSVPICGKICMDCMTVDVTDLPECRVGDTVVLLGQQGDEWISVNELAEARPFGVSGEVTCSIADRVPRVFINREN